MPQLSQKKRLKITYQIGKMQLWQQLGDPNRQQTWLEELVEAQAQAMHMTPKKRLKHLLQMEEQQKHARQIKCTNHSMREGGGLAKVTTTNNDGQVIQHYSKAGIEGVCLEEAKARFTQANDTPFPQEPFLLDLQLLGMHLPMFDQIADGTYRPPLGTPTKLTNYSHC